MSIKDLAVHVDHKEQCRKGLDVALRLAERASAHLTGIYVDSVPVSPELVAMSTAPVLLESIVEEQEQRVQRAKALFDGVTARSGVSVEWRRARGPMFEALNVHARYADMLVITQDGGGDDGGTGSLIGGLTDSAVIESGRPVLVVPYIGAGPPFDGHVLVAWNGSRESARAVNDALPVLKLASLVEVVTIDPKATELADAPLPGADLCLHLARHGINAEAKVIPGSDVDAGNMLLSHAADVGANLIVMGAYGHSRLRELVLGGMTLHLLRHMTVPVLMSH